MHDRLKARSEGLVTERFGDELVVYDRLNQTAHSLSADAASVWSLCDGELRASEIALQLGLGQVTVDRAIEELQSCGLFEDPSGDVPTYSRRAAAGRLAQLSGVAFAAPLIYSVAIPTAAAAASCQVNAPGCLPNGSSPTTCNAASNNSKGAATGCCGCECYQTNGTAHQFCVSATCVIKGGGCSVNSDCCSVQAGQGGTCSGTTHTCTA
jgi:hypothetical protein